MKAIDEQTDTVDVEVPLQEHEHDGDVRDKDESNTDTRPTMPNSEIEDAPSGFVPCCSCLKGMGKDLRARLPLYVDDWKPPRKILKVLNATLFAFVVQLIPALIFAELLDKSTEGSLSVAETLLSTGIIGTIHAVLSGQPYVFTMCSRVVSYRIELYYASKDVNSLFLPLPSSFFVRSLTTLAWSSSELRVPSLSCWERPSG